MNNLQMAMQIKAERKQYEQEGAIHNQLLHKQILESWKRDSPQMFARLTKQQTLDDLAYVSQQRMWRQMEQYQAGGMSRADARQEAEREHLMLEPETPELPQEIDHAFLQKASR